MNREQVFQVIDDERIYQDRTYNPKALLTSGQTREVRDLDVTPHLVLLDLYVQKAKIAWNAKGDNVPALQEIAKIAAIAVRALERARWFGSNFRRRITLMPPIHQQSTVWKRKRSLLDRISKALDETGDFNQNITYPWWKASFEIKMTSYPKGRVREAELQPVTL